MMEWIFSSALRWILAVGGWCGLDLRIHIPLIDDLFTWLGANVKIPWLLAFTRRVEDGPYWGQKPRSTTFIGAEHYLADIQDLEKNPPYNTKDNTACRTHRH